MPVQRSPAPFLRIPDIGDDHNLRDIELWGSRIAPYIICYDSTAIWGAVGAGAYATWTRDANKDPWRMLVNANDDPTLIWIPFDGLYSFWWIMECTAVGAITWLETANTSDTGISAPTWTVYPALGGGDKNVLALYSDIDLLGGDSVRMGAQGAGISASCHYSSFKLTMPIPTRTR